MKDQIETYASKLVADRAADPTGIAFAVQDDQLYGTGEPYLADLARNILSRLTGLAVVVARPALPFAAFLMERAAAGERTIVPPDTETRTFLHDIPFLRVDEFRRDGTAAVARLLGARKGIIVEGVGIVAVGQLTVEQAYINYSSIYHATFVKYLHDLLTDGFRLPGEEAAVRDFVATYRPATAEGLVFRPGPLDDPEDIFAEMAAVGRYTVERRLVDSFFGNISCRTGNVVYISQTAASLDALAGCIDPVPMDNATTAGITASSELLAHRKIYEATGARTILHAHPRFAVIMSMQCEEEGCAVTDCWKECPKVRFLGGTPVVAGEIGAGGLARRVPPVIGGPGRAIVYGHGVFTLGETGFGEAFLAMAAVENWCREEYFRRLEQQFGRDRS